MSAPHATSECKSVSTRDELGEPWSLNALAIHGDNFSIALVTNSGVSFMLSPMLHVVCQDRHLLDVRVGRILCLLQTLRGNLLVLWNVERVVQPTFAEVVHRAVKRCVRLCHVKLPLALRPLLVLPRRGLLRPSPRLLRSCLRPGSAGKCGPSHGQSWHRDSWPHPSRRPHASPVPRSHASCGRG